MSTFILAISCLTTFSLPWFMDLTFHVPVQYCSLQHQTLVPSPVISTTGCCFCFGSVSSFFVELFLHWFPVAYCIPSNLGSSSFSGIENHFRALALSTLWRVALSRQTFVGIVMSLIFNALFVTDFLPKSKCLLISWLQSPSAVIF